MVTAAQWMLIAPLLADKRIGMRRGRPFVHSQRRIFSSVLWILRTGAPWHDLPRSYPPYQTCHRRFQVWVKSGILRKALTMLVRDLENRGGIKLEECFIDGTFAPAKKGDSVWVKPNGERVRSSWQLQTLLVFQSPSTWDLLHRMK